MAIAGTQISVVTTIGTLYNGNGASVLSDVVIRNTGTAGTMFLGGATDGTLGFALTPGSSLTLKLATDEALYARTDTGTVVAHLLYRR
jgi:hypothetical protein